MGKQETEDFIKEINDIKKRLIKEVETADYPQNLKFRTKQAIYFLGIALSNLHDNHRAIRGKE
jgi:hypothetical protein